MSKKKKRPRWKVFLATWKKKLKLEQIFEQLIAYEASL